MSGNHVTNAVGYEGEFPGRCEASLYDTSVDVLKHSWELLGETLSCCPQLSKKILKVSCVAYTSAGQGHPEQGSGKTKTCKCIPGLWEEQQHHLPPQEKGRIKCCSCSLFFCLLVCLLVLFCFFLHTHTHKLQDCKNCPSFRGCILAVGSCLEVCRVFGLQTCSVRVLPLQNPDTISSVGSEPHFS